MKIKSLLINDKVAIVAPSGYLNKDDLNKAIQFLKENNLIPVFGKNLFKKSGTGYNFAGTDVQRVYDFQEAINNKNIKAIWCARGGYGAVKIIDKLDFSSLKNNFKWIIGYSDITIIHNKLNALKIPSLHAVTAKSFSTNASIESYISLKKVLFKKKLKYNIELKSKNYRNEIKGKLVGGNLSLIYSQLGVLKKTFFKNKILFIEDWHEDYYHLDRMIMNMKRNGVFNQIKALVIGSFTKMDDKDNLFYNKDFDETANKIITDELEAYNFPIFYNFPAGHINDNRALIFGLNLSITKNKDNFVFDFNK
ncbi:MAG: LD-carboxypeptidase [Solirubrobacteraceae bacterium]